MSTQTIDQNQLLDQSENQPQGQAVVVAPTPNGVYALPVVGGPLRQVRDIVEGLHPTAEDNAAVVVAKRTLQGAVITGAAAVAAIVVL